MFWEWLIIPRGWNLICDRAFLFFWLRIWRFICLLQEKSLSVLTLACCFLSGWSTKKTAGSCILDTGGLDNELPVWCCQKSFGSLVKHGACNINTSNPGTKNIVCGTVTVAEKKPKYRYRRVLLELSETPFCRVKMYFILYCSTSILLKGKSKGNILLVCSEDAQSNE